MSFKFRIIPLAEACPSCPFYIPGTDGRNHCFIKKTVPLNIAAALTNRQDTSSLPDDWSKEDCKGDWEVCAILPVLYDVSQESSEPVLTSADALPPREIFNVDEFNPYEETDEPDPEEYEEEVDTEEENEKEESEEEAVETLPVSKSSTARDLKAVKNTPIKQVAAEDGQKKTIKQALQKESEAEPENDNNEVKVSIHHQENPYLVVTDILVYPNNANLIVDDELFIDMTKDHIQDVCDQVRRPIRMGNVYCTGNGSTSKYRSRVAAKLIYHAVVAGESRLVNTSDIKSATFRCLATAEAQKARTMVMLPMDCGMIDTQQVALAQLGAIQNFLATTDTKTLKHIYIVIQDEDTVKVFEEFFDRIFARAK